MKEYLIDGNNLIHKDPALAPLQKKDPYRQLVREKLVVKLEGYFADKAVKVQLFLDGFQNDPIRTNKIKIIYSEKLEADVKVRRAIENSSNPKNLVVVSSDNDITKLAQACSASVVSSEKFVRIIASKSGVDEEEKRINELDNEEFKKLFGADD